MISKHHPSMFKTPKRLAVAACAAAIAAGFQRSLAPMARRGEACANPLPFKAATVCIWRGQSRTMEQRYQFTRK